MPIKTFTTQITLKRVLYSLLALILLLLIWAGFALFYDESPDVGRDVFYAISANKIPDNKNLAIAISGINAPEEKDSIKHGRLLIDASRNDLTRDVARFLANGPAKLSFVGKRDEFECWLDDKLDKTASNCASVERLKALLRANKTLFTRYQQLYTMPHWQGSTFGGGQTIIDINVLLAAEIKLDIDEGRSEVAYQKWRDNFVFINHILSTENTFIERAIFLVTDGFSLSSLEYLLFKSPETGLSHIAELNALLKPSGLEKYNLKGALRAEYSLFNENLILKTKATFFHPEFIRNRIYRVHKDFLDSVLKPPSTYKQGRSELQEKYPQPRALLDLNWLDPFNSLLSSMITSGFIKSFSLIESMHFKNAHINLLNLSMKIKQNKIAEANIQTYINQAGVDYNNPFTNQPMRYDLAKKVIFCEEPSSHHKVEARL